MNIESGYTQYLRNQRLKCPLCESEQARPFSGDEIALKKHLTEVHLPGASPTDREGVLQAIERAKIQRASPRQVQQQTARGASPKRVGPDQGAQHGLAGRPGPGSQERPTKRVKSPAGSAQDAPAADDWDFPRRPPPTVSRTLWEEGAPPLKPRPQARKSNRQSQRAAGPPAQRLQPRDPGSPSGDGDVESPLVHTMINQPETRPISPEQLFVEVEGIYVGLLMVENKCKEVDGQQNVQGKELPPLKNEQWQALIALHRTLLHEHHDFFLASQHPSATPSLRRLASYHRMPARMWKHGIHAFLEILRKRLPHSLEHMLTFICLAYSMLALLYETVPAFEETWMECLGDLSRYRYTIEDGDIRERETWTAVARRWYHLASDRAPTTGRLYHHQAIATRQSATLQLLYYLKSLCISVPFEPTTEGLLPVLNPVIQDLTTLPQPDRAFVKLHGMLFWRRFPDPKLFTTAFGEDVGYGDIFSGDRFSTAMRDFLGLLDGHIARMASNFLATGAHISISIACSVLEYGEKKTVPPGFILDAVKRQETVDDGAMVDQPAVIPPSDVYRDATALAVESSRIIWRRIGDPNVLSYIHCNLAFLVWLARFPIAWDHISQYPWGDLADYLNHLMISFANHETMKSEAFPVGEKGEARPLTEDWHLRGILFAEFLYPTDHFNCSLDEEDRFMEFPSMTEGRKERVLWLAHKLAASDRWIRYSEQDHKWAASQGSSGVAVSEGGA